VAAVLGVLRKIGLERIIASQASPERTLAVAMVVMRVIRPGSKLATARRVHSESVCCSLGLELGIESVSESDLYRAMDWLLERQSRIEAKLARKHLRDGTLVLYDVSSSYYTGKRCRLAKFGHSRDRKKGFPQIVYGLLCNAEGCPVATEVFEGNTGDPKTLSEQIEKIRPIHHWLEDRVRAHVFLCMLAYYVEWHMREQLRLMLFDDEDREGADALRASIVAPAKRSDRARKKDLTKRTEDGTPVHSFQTLLDDLGTLAKNRVRRRGAAAAEFYLLTVPTDVQRQTFDLLGVSLAA
jgi:hypothetical protein